MKTERYLKLGISDERDASSKAAQLNALIRKIDKLRDAVNSLRVLDSYGCADRWAILVCEEWNDMVESFVDFKADVDAFVQQQANLARANEEEES